METRTFAIDVLEDGIIMTFADGTVARYTANFLRQIADQAEILVQASVKTEE